MHFWLDIDNDKVKLMGYLCCTVNTSDNNRNDSVLHTNPLIERAKRVLSNGKITIFLFYPKGLFSPLKLLFTG